MLNVGNKLTVDDLIVEYMIYKVRNGYNPSYSTAEFITFLYFFEEKMPVADSLYDNYGLFKRFFERKNKSDWLNVKTKMADPHMKMEYDYDLDDFIIKANYKLSVVDEYFLNSHVSHDRARIKIFIRDFFVDQQKRQFDEEKQLDDIDIIVGKNVANEIMNKVWHWYVWKQRKNKKWPAKCNDINKYLLQFDFAKLVGAESIKERLLSLYDNVSKKVAMLYHDDKELKFYSTSSSDLATANYNFIFEGFEDLIEKTCMHSGRSIEFDFSDPQTRLKYEQNPNEDARKMVKK